MKKPKKPKTLYCWTCWMIMNTARPGRCFLTRQHAREFMQHYDLKGYTIRKVKCEVVG